MNSRRTGLGALAGAIILLCSAFLALNADPPRAPSQKGSAKNESGIPAEKSDDASPVSVAEARERAKLMHKIHSATLEALHHHYFRREQAVLPARAMEDVFAELDKQEKIKTRWIAVNTPAMSIDHEPQTEFEKEAATQLANGKPAFDRVVKGTYYRAGAVSLGAGCLGCHTKLSAPTAKTP